MEVGVKALNLEGDMAVPTYKKALRRLAEPPVVVSTSRAGLKARLEDLKPITSRMKVRLELGSI